ncbi:MAG: hypothetical protein ACE5K8_06495 [Candidatus Zixiibacteriota bacterium]
MSKMFRYVLLVTLATLLVAPLATGQTKKTGERVKWPTYYSFTDPGNDTLPWDSILQEESDSVVVAPNSTIWIGVENFQVDDQKKKFYLILKGDNVNNLDTVNIVAYDSLGSSALYNYYDYAKTGTADSIRTYVLIVPQPHWEVIALKNKGAQAVTITGGFGNTYCTVNVPSLTEYGLLVLLVLLILSGIYVIYQRRKGVARA